jgi:hypothetical protein
VKRGYPVLRHMNDDPSGPEVPREVLELTPRVKIIPSHDMTLFGPRITIFMKNGKSYTRQGTGREFIWDFEEEVRRISGIATGIPIAEPQFQELISTCRTLDREARADKLVQLTIKR